MASVAAFAWRASQRQRDVDAAGAESEWSGPWADSPVQVHVAL